MTDTLISKTARQIRSHVAVSVAANMNRDQCDKELEAILEAYTREVLDYKGEIPETEPTWRKEFKTKFVHAERDEWNGEDNAWLEADFEEVMDFIGELLYKKDQANRAGITQDSGDV